MIKFEENIVIIKFKNILKMDIEKSFEERLAEINDKIKDAEENFGET